MSRHLRPLFPLAVFLSVGISVAVFAQPAAAVQESNFGFATTEDLYRVCAVEEGDANYAQARLACHAFITATVQYHDAVTDRRNLKRLICYPTGTKIADGRAAFLAWARENAGNQERMSEVPVVGLVRGLAKTYPCR